jgi:gentisate 1,2-dioxygenase
MATTSNKNEEIIVLESEHAKFYEYSKASDPVDLGLLPQIPRVEFLSQLHQEGKTRIIPFDNSRALKLEWSASTPALLANFIVINPGESIATNPNATAEVYYCIRGRGKTEIGSKTIDWKKGDIMTIPAGLPAVHTALENSAFYWVHDGPLLNYLGVENTIKRFEPTLYPAQVIKEKLDEQLLNAVERRSIILANEALTQTRTTTHTLSTIYGVISKHTNQLPHRRSVVAVDFVVKCPLHGCYTLLGDELDSEGNIKNPVKVLWRNESSFITPSYKWHSHHNESNEDAYLLTVQDAGLQTHLRTLNTEFFQKENVSSQTTGKFRK